MGLPYLNWFQICNLGGAGTQLGRALGPKETPLPLSNYPRKRTAVLRGRQGSSADPLPQALARPSPRGPSGAVKGAAQIPTGRAGLGRGPQDLGAQGTSPRAPREAGAAGSAVQTLPGPKPRRPALRGGRDHPRRRQRGNWPSPRPGDAAGPRGSAWPPHSTLALPSGHCPPWRDPNLTCSAPVIPSYSQRPAPPECLQAGPRRRRAPEREGPPGPRAWFQRPENGNCAKRNPKSGRAQSPPAYIKPQEPSRPPAVPPPRGERSAGARPGRPGAGTATDPAHGPGVTRGGVRGLGLFPPSAPETFNWPLITLAVGPN